MAKKKTQGRKKATAKAKTKIKSRATKAKAATKSKTKARARTTKVGIAASKLSSQDLKKARSAVSRLTMTKVSRGGALGGVRSDDDKPPEVHSGITYHNPLNPGDLGGIRERGLKER